MHTPIKIGISACLTGQKVRYDGGDKRDPFIMDTLGPSVQFVPVCPEAECGLGIPREAMRLAGDPARRRLLVIRSGRDLTAQMQTWAEKRVSELAEEELRGFIIKSRSPSCGLHSTKFFDARGRVIATGAGLFAEALRKNLPGLPLAEEEDLRDQAFLQRFLKALGIS